MLPRCPRLPALIVLTACAAASAAAESLPDGPEPRYCQIRTMDRRITDALEHGLHASPTFRELSHRINASDVVVYLAADTGAVLAGLDGRLTFLSATGGYRYVVVHVNTNLAIPRLVALIGHELQHAREIADTESIVDADSMAREYATRIGYHNHLARSDRSTFDSRAAIRAGELVLRELLE